MESVVERKKSFENAMIVYFLISFHQKIWIEFKIIFSRINLGHNKKLVKMKLFNFIDP